ncbi:MULTISPECIES: hypothetical protein [unclassified Sphingomonas]|uniref:hypothetical protein n=1 Tax=unclassified Sphingomonas TaxID=196159 RepID=UPI0006FD2805|nr:MULTISPECIES: hypothetical protein [unclassified Sphingomonas]KQM28695.1 hypothetical protein ASE58_02150 [Sphingomonas sp. Leaf9]KQM45398.1 hypothetical protein ASE57_02145 [Sphingomonas sp. Leaf11]
MLLAALLLQAAASPDAKLRRLVRVPPCAREAGEGSRKYLVYRGDRICVDLDLPRVYEGIWIDEFEGQAFAEGANSRADLNPTNRLPWLNTYEALTPFTKPAGSKGLYYGRLYKVRFVGRQAVDMKREPMLGYGHFNLSPGLIVLNEMLSITPLDTEH